MCSKKDEVKLPRAMRPGPLPTVEKARALSAAPELLRRRRRKSVMPKAMVSPADQAYRWPPRQASNPADGRGFSHRRNHFVREGTESDLHPESGGLPFDTE